MFNFNNVYNLLIVLIKKKSSFLMLHNLILSNLYSN